ncbi:MarR family transcriptional regulator [Cloacibacillus sp. An23]|uniref:MarR family winged helix-turn-helix transcriptional regulator n=1 Tax=Cloacibacillus sp. An23 TaxID=1965591 RepID=UPI000B555088|nr:MarR family transcriptional regulator [Cloacibacillus sp. An23]OUO95093.1 MarR family transcriptional regulator [Cloacibacillus sp. An23]
MESLHYLLMKAHGAMRRAMLAEGAKLGLTPGQPKILEFLMKNGESDQKTLAADCEIEQATAGGILLRMEEAGLIARRRKEGNRRSLYVSLTAAGAEAARRMDDAARGLDRRAASRLPDGAEERLKEMLASVRDAVSSAEGERR